MGYVKVDKPAPTTGIRPERDREPVDTACIVHPKVEAEDEEHVETLGYDDRDDTYLQRCTYTGKTWWVRQSEAL